MLLTLGFAVLALTLVLVIASATAVHIERKRLLALADAAAADAAVALDEAIYYDPDRAVPARLAVPLSDATVQAAVGEYLARAPTAEFTALAVTEPTGTPDGVTAQVSLTAVARPPLVLEVLDRWAGGIPLRVTATARAG